MLPIFPTATCYFYIFKDCCSAGDLNGVCQSSVHSRTIIAKCIDELAVFDGDIRCAADSKQLIINLATERFAVQIKGEFAGIHRNAIFRIAKINVIKQLQSRVIAFDCRCQSIGKGTVSPFRAIGGLHACNNRSTAGALVVHHGVSVFLDGYVGQLRCIAVLHVVALVESVHLLRIQQGHERLQRFCDVALNAFERAAADGDGSVARELHLAKRAVRNVQRGAGSNNPFTRVFGAAIDGDGSTLQYGETIHRAVADGHRATVRVAEKSRAS